MRGHVERAENKRLELMAAHFKTMKDYPSFLKTIVTLIERNPRIEDYYNILYNESLAWGKLGDVVPILVKYSQLFPDYPQVLLLLGHAYTQLGDFESAAIAQEKLVKLRGTYDDWCGYFIAVNELCSRSKAKEVIDEIIRHFPNEKHNWYYKGRYYLRELNYDEAEKCFLQILGINHHDSEMWGIVCGEFFSVGELDREISFLETVKRWGVSYPFIDDRIRKAQQNLPIMRKLEESTRALPTSFQAWSRFVDFFRKEHFLFFGLLGKFLAITGISYQQISSDKTGHYLNDSGKCACLYNLGYIFCAFGRLFDSIKIFDNLISLKPSFKGSWVGLAMAYHMTGQYPLSVNILRHITEMDPTDNRIWKTFYDAAFYGNPQESGIVEPINILNAILGNDPSDRFALINKSMLFIASKVYDSAVQICDQGLAIMPDCEELTENRKIALKMLTHPASKETYTINFRKEIPKLLTIMEDEGKKMDERGPTAYNQEPFEGLHHGVTIMTKVNLPLALSSCEIILKSRPEDGLAWYKMGEIRKAQKEYPLAKEAYQNAVKYNPQYMPAWIELGNLLLNEQKIEDVISLCEKAIQIKHDDPRILTLYGVACYRQSRNEDARQALERVEFLNPAYLESSFFLGLVYKDMGQIQKAIANFERIVSCDPDIPVATASRGLAKQLRENPNAPVMPGKLITLIPLGQPTPDVPSSSQQKAPSYMALYETNPSQKPVNPESSPAILSLSQAPPSHSIGESPNPEGTSKIPTISIPKPQMILGKEATTIEKDQKPILSNICKLCNGRIVNGECEFCSGHLCSKCGEMNFAIERKCKYCGAELNL